MSRGAAFFDLDRTLLAGASGEVFAEAMREAGLTSRDIPGASALFKLFNTVGETLPSMLIARQTVRLATGHSRARVSEASAAVAPKLAAMVQPAAAEVFAEHRAAGRKLVLATTTPYDMVAPLADLLGLDDVVATRYVVDANGDYTGQLAGEFVWSTGKRDAVLRWAKEHDVDLADSAAYSDSFYDAPLLDAVGQPFVVNPDPRMRVLATLRRWPVISLAGPRHGLHLPVIGDVQRRVLDITNPLFVPYAKFDIAGEEHIPDSGPAIVVGNHRSYFDPMAVAMVLARTNRTVRFLGKKEVFDAPVIGQIASAMGGIRVDRGTGSDAPLKAAAEALEAGDVVAIMPQGTIPRGKAFFDPVLKGRWGAARLAAHTGAPVVPIGLWGTEEVWPRSSRVPAVFNVFSPPTVRVRVGSPVPIKGRSADADTKRIMTAITALLPDEARVRREPTAEEIARAQPPGYRGNPNGESTRRPGTD